MATTANLGMDLPTVSETLGPEWAEKLNTALEEKVDQHDHSESKGARVPASGLNIDADLPVNGNNVTHVRAARFESQDAELAEPTDLGELYRVGGDLYWNDGSGNPVQITDGASLAAASLGAIGGLPSGTASVNFSSGTGTYTFKQATNEAGAMDVGPVTIRDTAASANGITVQSPSGLVSAYDLTLPTALPGAESFLTINTSGQIAASPATAGGIGTSHLASGAVTSAKLASFAVTSTKIAGEVVLTSHLAPSAVTTAKIADGNVTNSKLAGGIGRSKIEDIHPTFSSDVVLFSTAAASTWTDVPGLSVTGVNNVLSSARYIEACLVAADDTDAYVGSADTGFYVRLYHTTYTGSNWGMGGSPVPAFAPPGAFRVVFNPSASGAPHGFKVQVIRTGSGTISFSGLKLMVRIVTTS